MQRTFTRAATLGATLVAVMLSIGAAAVEARAEGLGDTRTVYLLPMAGGLDQYLAVGLTGGSVLQVVADPLKADAVFTDHLGESFEGKLDELYGSTKQAQAKADDKSSDQSQTFTRVQGARHGRGAAFLVDRKTREVIWSVYDRPKDSTFEALKRSADRIVEKLAKATKPK